MDAKDSNEFAIRQRDARLARRLGEALDRLNPQAAGNCPDAEVLAAYSENALGADEVTQCENHFAACGRCRNILKVLAAGSDAPLAETEVAQLGQRVATLRPPVEISAGAEKPPRSKAGAWSTRWLAPAFGVAAVLTVWFVMRPPWRAMDRSGSTTLIAQTPREEMPQPERPDVAEQSENAAPAPEAPAAKRAAPNGNAEPSANEDLKSKDAFRDGSPTESFKKSLGGEKNEIAPLESENKSKALAEPAPPPNLPQSTVSSAMNSAAPMAQSQGRMDGAAAAAPIPASPNPAIADTTRSTAQTSTAMEAATAVGGMNKPAAAPRKESAADVQANAKSLQMFKQMRVSSAPLILKAASGAVLWRVGIGGSIERSTDAGKTWSPQISPSKDDWLVGAAISDSICWLAGRGGSIARTMDGEHWEGIAPPAQMAKTDGELPDWTGISARDAQTATLTAGDGTKFATTDGGKTWQRQP